MEGLMGSASALRKFKMRHGFNVAGANNTSAYIAMCKLRKALTKDFTAEMHKKFLDNKNYSSRKGLTKDKIADRMINRLERLPAETVKLLHRKYQDHGLEAMIEALHKPWEELRANYVTTIK